MTTFPAPSSKKVRLREALEVVYREFSMPTPSRIEGCPCCIDTRRIDVLLATELRELTGEDLWRYVSGAFYTVGGEYDFRYLLPRILDVSVTDPGNANNPEIVLGKLRLAQWQSWSPGEQQAIHALIDAWFEEALERDLSEADTGWIGEEAASVLCGAARADLSLSRWLVRLHEPSAAPILSDLRERYSSGPSPFWKDAPVGFQELSRALAQTRT